MPEPNLPKSSADLQRIRKEAEREQAGHTVQTALSFSPAAPALALSGQLFPEASKKIGRFALGVEVKPRPGKPAAIRPGRTTILYALPAPIGITPPEMVGLAPDYLGRAFPALPKSETFATGASPARTTAFAFQARQRELFFESLSVRQGYQDNQLRAYLLDVIKRRADEPLQAGAYDRLIQAVYARAARVGYKDFAALQSFPVYSRPGSLFSRPYLGQENAPEDGPNAQGAALLQATNPPDP